MVNPINGIHQRWSGPGPVRPAPNNPYGPGPVRPHRVRPSAPDNPFASNPGAAAQLANLVRDVVEFVTDEDLLYLMNVVSGGNAVPVMDPAYNALGLFEAIAHVPGDPGSAPSHHPVHHGHQIHHGHQVHHGHQLHQGQGSGDASSAATAVSDHHDAAAASRHIAGMQAYQDVQSPAGEGAHRVDLKD